MSNKKLESQIQKEICEYLEKRGHFFWRENNTPIFDPTRKQFRRMPKYARKGVPDIFIVQPNRIVGLEVKRPKTYQSPHQKEFEKDLKAAGGEYYVVRCINDVRGLGL